MIRISYLSELKLLNKLLDLSNVKLDYRHNVMRTNLLKRQVGVDVGLCIGVGVGVCISGGLGVGECVGVDVGVDVCVDIGVYIGVGVCVNVYVGVGVGIDRL